MFENSVMPPPPPPSIIFLNIPYVSPLDSGGRGGGHYFEVLSIRRDIQYWWDLVFVILNPITKYNYNGSRALGSKSNPSQYSLGNMSLVSISAWWSLPCCCLEKFWNNLVFVCSAWLQVLFLTGANWHISKFNYIRGRMSAKGGLWFQTGI